jgi:2-keto-3-deoxy-L-rhamnonate aldolase RhmA
MKTIANLASCFQATKVTAIVRIHKLFAHLIPGILDQGIMGIQVSEVETAQQARIIVRLAKYPPIGHRGISASGRTRDTRAMAPRHATEYAPWANENIIIPVDSSRSRAWRMSRRLRRPNSGDLIAPQHQKVSISKSTG